ncbi:MAG: sensor histidine kinase, partial [Melioribacteraceae bacterium]|nr:sensor histidine kinase [Melioribacteraceae bacterium]
KLNIDTAVPCGLIVNELVSNSMKYAFPENCDVKNPKINISIKRLDELKYRLVISDNGVGVPIDYDQENSKSLGLQLVNSLIAQVEGKLEVGDENGTEYKITFIDRNKVRTEKNE